jgi:hypothetical protein
MESELPVFGGGIMRRFLNPVVLLAIAAAVLACADAWPNPL